MSKRIRISAALALSAGMGATTAQAAAPTVSVCVSETEATSLLLAVAPDAIKAAGTACATTLPPAALIRQTSGPFIDKYRAASDGAWSGAKTAIGKLIGGEQASALDPEMMRPMVSALVVTALTVKIKPADCSKIDRAVTLLAPLPPANAAELFMMFANEDRPGKKSMLTLCPAAKS